MNNDEEQIFYQVPYPGLTLEETKETADIWLELGADPNDVNFLSAMIPIRPIGLKIDDVLFTKADQIFKHIDKAIIVDFDKFFGPNNDPDFNYFIVSSKRCYNKVVMRHHITKYLNFFEKIYDTDHELVMIYHRIKYFIDYLKDYNEYNFITDLKRYIIFNRSILHKLHCLNIDSYSIELKRKKGKSIKNLQYDTKHGKILMQMSFLMIMVCPLITHFITVKNMMNNDLILKVYDIIINMSDVDIYSKLYETASYEIGKSQKIHTPLWDKQDIRGKDPVTHAIDSINNIILNIMPKYRYNNNIISLNSSSIKESTKYGVLDIKYEHNFKRLSSSDRDEDFNSEFDKYEAYQIKQDENGSMRNRMNCYFTNKQLNQSFRIDDDEVAYYKERLHAGGSSAIIQFQKARIFNLFYKYFGDPISLYENNLDSYVRLMIMAKQMLLSRNMILLPYVISGKINKLSNRKNLNMKERHEIESSPTWELIDQKYCYNPKIKDLIYSEIATIITSSFSYIDFYDRELDGKNINIITSLIREEYLNYILLI